MPQHRVTGAKERPPVHRKPAATPLGSLDRKAAEVMSLLTGQLKHGLDALGPVGIRCALKALNNTLLIKAKAVGDEGLNVHLLPLKPVQGNRIGVGVPACHHMYESSVNHPLHP